MLSGGRHRALHPGTVQVRVPPPETPSLRHALPRVEIHCMTGLKTCRACSEQMRATSIVCGFCGFPLVPETDMRLKAARAKAAAIRDGNAPSVAPGPGRWTGFSVRTLLLLGLAGFLSVLGLTAGSQSLAFFAFAGLFGIPAVFMAISDIGAQPPKVRHRPQTAISAFLDSLARRRYARAYRCISPLDRNTVPRMTFEMKSLSSQVLHATFETPISFGRYWRSLVGGWDRGLKYLIMQTEITTPSTAIVTVELRIKGLSNRAPSLVGLGGAIPMLMAQREDTFEVRKLVFLHDDRWWLANGELGDWEDEAISALLSKTEESQEA